MSEATGVRSAAKDGVVPPPRVSASFADADRLLVALLVATIVLPLLVFALASLLSYRQHFSAAQEQLSRSADLVLEHVKKVFETHELVVAQVDEVLAGLNDDDIRAREQSVHQRLRQLNDMLDQFQDILVIDRGGNLLVSATAFPVPRRLDLSDREYVRGPRDGLVPPGTTYVSETLPGRDPAGRFAMLSKARRTGAGVLGFNGVTSVSLSPDYFERFYAQIADGTLSGVMLLRDDGAIIARWPDPAAAADRLPQGAALLRAVEETPDRGVATGALSGAGPDQLFAYRRLPSYPVLVAVSLDVSAVRAAWLATMASHLAFGGPATAALILLILYARRTLDRERQAAVAARDAAERRAEAEMLLRHAQRIEALGQLVGGVAHDFNNVVQSVQAGTRLIRKRSQDDETIKIVEILETTAERGARLIQRMLAFARREETHTETTDVADALVTVSELLERTLGSGVRLTCEVAPATPSVVGDRAEFETTIVNLAINARDAMPRGGTIRITAAIVASSAETRDHVRIDIADTGIGMDEATLAKAAEAFFTTKAPGKGTGLGLAQARAFAERAGGRLAIESAPGVGTTVTLFLPVAALASDGVPQG
jgi:signal transduction histidine kinase